MTLFQKDLITGGGELLLKDPPPTGVFIDDGSPDGRFVILRSPGRSLYSFSMYRERTFRLIAQIPYGQDQSHVSPDGKWIAYHANESGRSEICLARFPDFTDKQPVSRSGGLEPLWRGDGKELFYLDFDGRMIVLPVTTEPTLEVGTPSVLFETKIRPGQVNHYTVADNGQRFLVLEPLLARGEPLTVLLDWTTRLEEQ